MDNPLFAGGAEEAGRPAELARRAAALLLISEFWDISGPMTAPLAVPAVAAPALSCPGV